MKKPIFWEKAKKDLIKKDRRLGNIIKNYPKDFLFSKSDPFYTLARSIIGQQISVKAAQAVWDRFENKILNGGRIIAATNDKLFKKAINKMIKKNPVKK